MTASIVYSTCVGGEVDDDAVRIFRHLGVS
jgi:hypothetical protein